MKTRYLFAFAISIALGLTALAPAPSCAAYPDHPIQFVIANVAGASMDVTGRMLASELEKALGELIAERYERKSIATNAGPNGKSHMNSPILPGGEVKRL